MEQTETQMDEPVEVHYQRLVHTLWNKGFQLGYKEDHQCQEVYATTTDLGALYKKMTAIRDQLNMTKGKVHEMVMANNDNNSSTWANSAKHDNTLDRWRSYTSFTYPMRQLPRCIIAKCAENGLPPPQLCTQAYCKFLQMAAAYPALIEVPTTSAGGAGTSHGILRSLHLCEAPGAFVLALKHCLAGKGISMDWRMNSLNPHYSNANASSLPTYSFTTMATDVDDQLIKANPDRMAYGWDNSGNIFNWDQKYSEKLCAEGGGKFHLVTADGGIDCTDEPQEQESRTRPLIQQQFQIASQCLCLGGTLLLKAYTFFEPQTISLLANISTSFEQVHCLKPPSSKPGNSEIYLLCFGFLGVNNKSSSVQPPPTQKFLQRLEQCARFFADHQMSFIQFNLRTFRRLSQSERTKLEVQKCSVQGVMAEFLWQKIHSGLLAEQQKISNDNEETMMTSLQIENNQCKPTIKDVR